MASVRYLTSIEFDSYSCIPTQLGAASLNIRALRWLLAVIFPALWNLGTLLALVTPCREGNYISLF